MEETLGKRIMMNRKRLGLTQDQLAEKLGVTAQAVSKWENNQSCPDITLIPQLADIFGISTDELLGRSQESFVHEAEVVDEPGYKSHKGFQFQNGPFEFCWDGGRKSALGFAILVMSVGLIYLLSGIFAWDVSFWDILWPTSLLIYGVFGLFPRFSFFRLGCALVGGYYLMNQFVTLPIHVDGRILLAIILLLFGLSLFVDALDKAKRPVFNVTYTDKTGKQHHGRPKNDYKMGKASFSYETSFGSAQQLVNLDLLNYGKISTSFGEYTVDLSGVSSLSSEATLDVSCSFGELTILVPHRFSVKPDSSTAFASLSVEGQPSEIPVGELQLDASVSFGEIRIKYI